jgi:hypothetical protein
VQLIMLEPRRRMSHIPAICLSRSTRKDLRHHGATRTRNADAHNGRDDSALLNPRAAGIRISCQLIPKLTRAGEDPGLFSQGRY